MIDFHTHLGRHGKPNETERTYGLEAPELVCKMDEWGIEKSVVLPLCDSPEGWYYRSSTDDVIAYCNRFPDRLIPFVQLDPRWGDNSPETDFSGALEEFKQRGCRGAGEVIANLYFDDPLVINYMQHCGRADLPVVIHAAHCIGGVYGLADDAGLPRLERLLEAAPDTIICAHGPAFWSEISSNVPEETRGGYPMEPVEGPGRACELLEKCPNLYGDLSAGSGANALKRSPEFGWQFLERFQDRLLFATDTMRRTMLREDVPQIDYFADLRENGRISESAYAKITHDNAARLLGL